MELTLLGEMDNEIFLQEAAEKSSVSKSAAAQTYHRDYVKTRKKAYRIKNSNRKQASKSK